MWHTARTVKASYVTLNVCFNFTTRLHLSISLVVFECCYVFHFTESAVVSHRGRHCVCQRCVIETQWHWFAHGGRRFRLSVQHTNAKTTPGLGLFTYVKKFVYMRFFFVTETITTYLELLECFGVVQFRITKLNFTWRYSGNY